MRIQRKPEGYSVSMDTAQWHHPWTTKPYWNAARKEWSVIVRPGFVNGICPSVLTTPERMKSTPAFLAPVTAWDGAADIAQAATLADGGNDFSQVDQQTRVFVPLYRNPLLALNTRPLTGDAGAPIPAYFTRRGVTAGGRRLLVSSDIVLHQPRTGLTSQVDIQPGLLTGISNVTQTLGLASPIAADTLKLFSTPDFSAIDPNAGIDPLTNDYTEYTWDELLVATVFLLSPPDATGQPDGSWTALVRHSLFWNLQYAQPVFEVIPNLPGIFYPIVDPVGGGLIQIVVNSFTSSLNDAMQNAVNMITAHSMAGTFWTATGGGSSATFPSVGPVTTATDSFGFAKDARIAAARKAAALKAGLLVDTLDPAFPFTALPFSLSLLHP